MRQVPRSGGQIRVRSWHRALILVPVMFSVATALGACGSDDGGAGAPAATIRTLGQDAGSAACEDLLGRLPRSVLSQERVTADHPAGQASWGDPAVQLACGAVPTGPTTDQCIDVNDVAWVFSETPENYRFLTYGREPAVEVLVPTSIDRTQATGVLVDLSAAVAPLEQTERRCYDLADSAPGASPAT